MPTPSLPMQIGVPLDQDLSHLPPMQFGVSLDEMSPLFFGSLAVAIWLVYQSCQAKFAERSVTGSNDYIYQLLPRQLATHEEYSKGFLAYFGTMVATVVLLSLLGPKNLGTLGITLPAGVTNVAVPFAIAFILIGALPTVPGLMAIEKFLREYAHQRAYIPDAARATAERLAAADFDFSSYQGDVLHSPEMRGVDPADFTRPRRSLAHDWARLCCLVYVQKSCRMDDLTSSLDASLLRDYAKDLDLIESQKKAMESQVAAARIAKAADPYYTNDALRQDIRDNLYKLYILLGCAVRLKAQPRDIDLALAQFGFRLNHATRGPDNRDLKLVALAAVAAIIATLGLAATGLGQLGLWAVSPVFPQTVFQPFIDAAATLLPHATAIMVADIMRRHAVAKGSWFSSSGPQRRANNANYIRVAIVCGVAGYVALILWGLTQQAPTVDGFKIEVPNALLAMATGGFYAYHLDNAEVGRPSRVWELGAQMVVTGLCGLVAACATWQIIFGAASAATDRIVLTTLVSAAVGFALAWYIPQAAAAARPNPLANAGEERIRALASAARRRFLCDHDAEAWLDTPHPALGDKTPRVAATADVNGYERAIGLLQGPRAVAA